MSLESFLSGCLISCNVKLSAKTTNSKLLKKCRNASSNLNMAYHEFAVADYLLSLSEVGDITFVINASCKVPGALLFIGPSGN